MKMHHGVKLNEVTEPQVFDPPKEMYVWDEGGYATKKPVYAIGSQSLRYPVLTSGGNFHHCAEIPESRLATQRELARWLAVSDHHKDLWRKQAEAMRTYKEVLGERIKDSIDN